jgi:hypothetical protein
MSEHKVTVVFTAKSVERLLCEGGTSSWRLDRNNARRCEFAVCTRNAHAEWAEGPEKHHSAFLIGRVQDVVPSPDYVGRYLIQFSEYALVNVPEVWKGDRNPVRYASSLQDLGIDSSILKWTKMPELAKTNAPATDPSCPFEDSTGEKTSQVIEPNTGHQLRNGIAPLTLTDAKKGLALTFGVAPEAIEITIRG